MCFISSFRNHILNILLFLFLYHDNADLLCGCILSQNIGSIMICVFVNIACGTLTMVLTIITTITANLDEYLLGAWLPMPSLPLTHFTLGCLTIPSGPIFIFYLTRCRSNSSLTLLRAMTRIGFSFPPPPSSMVLFLLYT